MYFSCPRCQIRIETDADETAYNTCPSCGETLELPRGVLTGLAAGSRLEQFSLIELVGEGSYGSVWRAYDERLDRTVAVKVPRAGAVDTRRLLTEARAAAQIRHPGIVEVYEIGSHEGCPYIVSEFIEGRTLEAWIDETQPDALESAEVCRDLATAMHEAHRRDVIHRDLKPGNVMVDGEDAVHITDFGVAKRADMDGALTLDGELLGTPAYMSPEQARGESRVVDCRSDVYALGAILYRMLSGQAPYSGGAHRVLMEVVSGNPPALPEEVPESLRQICLRAMSRQADDRYEDMRALADDLNCFLSDTPVQAQAPPNPPGRSAARLNQFVQRYPLPCLIVGLLLVVPLAAHMAGTDSGSATKPRIGMRDPRLSGKAGTRVRHVLVRTTPPASRLLLVPTIGRTCLKDTRRRTIELRGQAARRPIPDVEPGTYLVVAQTGNRFHEVLRTIPNGHTPMGSFNHNSWDVEGNCVHLPPITLFKNAEVEADLLPVPGGECRFGTPEDDMAYEFHAWVNPYLLGRWETGEDEYRKVLRNRLSIEPEVQTFSEWPAGSLDVDEALAFAEVLGCRLPTELEYEFAATGGGTRPFPEGSRDSPGSRRLASRSITPTGPRIVGPRAGGTDVGKWGHFNLFSSVGELTWSHGINTLYQVDDAARRRVGIHMEWFSIRDFPRSLAKDPWVGEGVRNRINRDPLRIRQCRMIGMRLARSIKPRWDWEKPGFQAEHSRWGPLDLSEESLDDNGIR